MRIMTRCERNGEKRARQRKEGEEKLISFISFQNDEKKD